MLLSWKCEGQIYILTTATVFPTITILYFYRDLDPGDISEQIALRKKLECKPFKWFMQEVAFDLYKHYPPVDPPDFVHGEIRYGTEFRIRIHLVRIRIQHFRLNTEPDPDPTRIQGFDDQKLEKFTAKKLNFLELKENIQHFKR